jgi:hypothetical protein
MPHSEPEILYNKRKIKADPRGGEFNPIKIKKTAQKPNSKANEVVSKLVSRTLNTKRNIL